MNDKLAPKSRPRLVALSGLRIFAALHIYLFHLVQAHQAGVLRFPVLDSLPLAVSNFFGRGFVSTGIFFQLSGYILAYVYVTEGGRLRTTDLSFWMGRVARFYPLYFISLLLLAPAPALLPITAIPQTDASQGLLVASNLTLTQAWFPNCAIAWNAPAWALSAFVTAYLTFPTFARSIGSLEQASLRWSLLGLSALSVLPALAYMIFEPDGLEARTVTSITLEGTWLAALRFNPLVWLPQFFSGVVLAILSERNRTKLPSHSVKEEPWVSWGDLSATAVVLLLAFVPGIPYVLLRHGLLAPIMLVVLADLAEGRGLLARFLGNSRFDRAADAGFALFALQMPVGVWFCYLAIRADHGSAAQLLGLIGVTLATAFAWTEFVQRPVVWLFKQRRLKSAPPPLEVRAGDRLPF